MKSIVFSLIFCLSVFSLETLLAQDTFSIVAVDSATGEVGSAGASCLNLFAFSFPNDDFLGVLVPGVGAINTQASYLLTNQNNATDRMLLGNEPDSIISYLLENDAQSNPDIRQYGIAAFVNGSPKTAAHTGISTFDYKNHVLGPNYAIQGNILSGQNVLDSMEARFLREPGDLACKLMAAMQGANMVGADSRCASEGTSSLFAFLKVSAPGDSPGAPYFKISVRTQFGDQVEPIDSLQTLFDQNKFCGPSGTQAHSAKNVFKLYPNPASDRLKMSCDRASFKTPLRLVLVSVSGSEKKEFVLNSVADELFTEGLSTGLYFYSVYEAGEMLHSGKISIQR